MKTVYFMKPVGMAGPIKVGCSHSPTQRQSDLETWSPFALEIIATIDGDHSLERKFHAYFIETHQRREWFSWSQKMADTIVAINAGRFDIGILPLPKTVTQPLRNRQWTPEQKLSAQLNRSARKVFHATGYYPPRNYAIQPDDVEIMKKYLEKPHIYGRYPKSEQTDWPSKARAEYLASIAA